MGKNTFLLLLILFTSLFVSCSKKIQADTALRKQVGVSIDKSFRFYVATDVHSIKQRDDYTSLCFQNKILPKIKNAHKKGEFIIITGDLDPFFRVKNSVHTVMGEDYRFYPVVGNHDVGKTNNQYKDYPDDNWCDAMNIVEYNKNRLKNIVNWGHEVSSPALNDIVYKDSLSGKIYHSTYDKGTILGSKYTTYSFDEGNSHFVVLDQYSGLEYVGAEHNGRISNELYNWLAEDLSQTKQKNIFVFAHQPVWNPANEDGLVNVSYKSFCKSMAHVHGIDSLGWFDREYTSKIKSRKVFWDLLKKHEVVAYFCGHTHSYTANNIEGVWEINLEFGAWSIEGRTRYGEILVENENVKILVNGYIEGTEDFKIIETIQLKNAK